MSVVDDLNAAQRAVVEHFEGPLLVLAGPGSGKTRVITRRIARLIERGVPASQIIAITFTNKASNEMARRVADLLPGEKVWVSTFHKLCALLLRKYARAAGLQPNFTILDSTDQRQLLRRVLSNLSEEGHKVAPAEIAQRISEAKSQLLTAELYAEKAKTAGADYLTRIVVEAYQGYEHALLRSNAVDFDDLLAHVCRLLDDSPEIRATLDERFKFILVDEYQDTNTAQYRILRAMSQEHPHVCATGDPDQSIYRWRGADLNNILRFERDYPNSKVLRLEQNYRSTKGILRAADTLIGHNLRRKAKSLFTENAEGHPVELLNFIDQSDEAEGIARLIADLARRENRPWTDFAVTYRVNALSRTLELAFLRHGIPYQVAAGVAFFERTEVKDVLAYLRLIHNPRDTAAFERVVNVPVRGVGERSLRKLLDWGLREGVSPLDAAAKVHQIAGLSKKAAVGLRRFADVMHDLTTRAFTGIHELLRSVLDRTAYREALRDGSAEDQQQRVANVEELLTAAEQYDLQHADDVSLEGFLEAASLASEVDSVDESKGLVTLMTLHSAKGLEYPVVFVMAVEQNILPHERAMKDVTADELEEERRLLFVGMTRARERLHLTQTVRRAFRGRNNSTIPSVFLENLGPQLQSRQWHDGEWVEGPPFSEAPTTFSSGPDPAVESHKQRLRDLTATGKKPLLTTGAALLNGESTPAFAAGMLVRHPKYGQGVILATSGTGKHQTLTVKFEQGEIPLQFRADKAPLNPIGIF